MSDATRLRVLGLVPARGGSRGIPRKNVRSLAGLPLLAYTAQAAKAARRLDRVVLSTEDEEIAAVGRRYGLETPFRRPDELAQDETPTLPVVRHAIEELERAGDRFDAVCLLQPTHPLRRSEDVDACVEKLEREGADCVMTTLPIPPEHNPHWAWVPCADGCLHLSTGELAPIPRRQELPPAFFREGSVYVTRRDVVMEQGSLYGRLILGYEVDPARSVNLDTPRDWERAEAALAGLGAAVR
jgi:CMP-N,N'-diacetyllegionaminic acid synthase